MNRSAVAALGLHDLIVFAGGQPNGDRRSFLFAHDRHDTVMVRDTA